MYTSRTTYLRAQRAAGVCMSRGFQLSGFRELASQRGGCTLKQTSKGPAARACGWRRGGHILWVCFKVGSMYANPRFPVDPNLCLGRKKRIRQTWTWIPPRKKGGSVFFHTMGTKDGGSGETRRVSSNFPNISSRFSYVSSSSYVPYLYLYLPSVFHSSSYYYRFLLVYLRLGADVCWFLCRGLGSIPPRRAGAGEEGGD